MYKDASAPHDSRMLLGDLVCIYFDPRPARPTPKHDRFVLKSHRLSDPSTQTPNRTVPGSSSPFSPFFGLLLQFHNDTFFPLQPPTHSHRGALKRSLSGALPPAVRKAVCQDAFSSYLAGLKAHLSPLSPLRVDSLRKPQQHANLTAVDALPARQQHTAGQHQLAQTALTPTLPPGKLPLWPQ